jgi:tRNA nucleotidyltransferase/poly(A) polymerase
MGERSRKNFSMTELEKLEQPRTFRVGGCVRDALLGIQSKDIDFTFVLPDSKLNESVEHGFQFMKYWMEGYGYEIFLETPEMFTIRAKFPPHHQFAGMVADFVLARKEIGYVEGTRRPILVLGTLEDDLIRRDFTLNAMAEDEDGNIIDLFGGREDLERKILRTPLPAQTTMMDDPLRILRSWRFSITKGFTIDASIIEVMRDVRILDKLEKVVSEERIREELLKMLKHDTVKTLKLIHFMNEISPRLYEILFKRLWLKPTFEKV